MYICACCKVYTPCRWLLSRYFLGGTSPPGRGPRMSQESRSLCQTVVASFRWHPAFLERALSACSLAGLGGDNRSGLNILATSPADDGNLAPATTHLHSCSSNSPAASMNVLLYHQPNHVWRSNVRLLLQTRTYLCLSFVHTMILKKRRALQQITRDCRLW